MREGQTVSAITREVKGRHRFHSAAQLRLAVCKACTEPVAAWPALWKSESLRNFAFSRQPPHPELHIIVFCQHYRDIGIVKSTL